MLTRLEFSGGSKKLEVSLCRREAPVPFVTSQTESGMKYTGPRLVSRSVTVLTVSAEVPPPTECEDAEDIYGPDVKAELPPHLSITKDVMERCIHLLSDPSLRLRLKVPTALWCCHTRNSIL